ncbi:MAG: tetratricopeptide repeat protein [Cyanobacteria bacterium]|nr:tetratricopeptide repeat protein [Cyanobacteriota bacterium]MDA0866578.1 tetratricopeptide repeat protein [Cyanobacteriota bacterium]
MGSTKLLPLLTNTASTTLTVWLYCTARAALPLQERVTEGWQQFDQGNIAAAIACFQEVLVRAQRLGDIYFSNIAGNSLQFVEQTLVDLEAELEALELNGDETALAQGECSLGYEHLSAAQEAIQAACFSAALHYLDQALRQFSASGQLTGVGQSLSTMATVHLATADYSRALTYGQAAIAVLEDCDALPDSAHTLQTLGLAHFHLGDWAAAQARLEQAATLYHRLADSRAEGITLNHLGQVYSQQKDFMFALATYEAALDCCLELPSAATQELTATVLRHTGQLYEGMGYCEFAIAPYRDALDTYQKLGDIAKATLLLQHLGSLYEAQGQYAMAVECYHQLQQIHPLPENPQ